MAIQKTIEYPNGTSASYWRIIRINNSIDGTCDVSLAGYVSKDIRTSNPEAYLDVKGFTFPIDKQYFIEGNAFDYAYSQIVASRKDSEGNETNEWVDSLSV